MDTIKKNIHIYVLLVISLLTLVPFIYTGFSNGDDLIYYVNLRNSNIWSTASFYAQDHGRFFFYLTIPFAHLMYVFDNYLITKALNVILVFANFITLGLIVKEIFKDKWLGYLSFLILITFVSIKGIFNPIVSYPIFFTFSFLLILLAIYFSVLYFNKSKNKHYVLSFIILFFGILFYESYLLYTPLIIYFIYKSGNDLSKKERIVKIIPFIILLLLYVITYLCYRSAYHSNYSGNSLATDFSVVKFLNTLLNFATGAYPMVITLSDGIGVYGGNSYLISNTWQNISNLILFEHITWLVKAIIISILLYQIVLRINISNKLILFKILIVSFIYIYIPSLPLALTQKYISYGGFPNYVTTYFSVFAVTVCFSILLSFILYVKKNFIRNIILLLLAFIFGLSSLINDYVNFETSKFLKVPLNMFSMLDKFISTNDYKKVEPKSFIYAPSLYDTRTDVSFFMWNFDLSNYFYAKSNKKEICISKSKKDLINKVLVDTSKIYYINYGRCQTSLDQFITLSELNNNSIVDSISEKLLSDSFVLYYNSKNKSFSVSFEVDSKEESSVVINNNDFKIINGKIYLEVINKNYSNDFIPIYVKGYNINMKSIVVSNIQNMENTNILNIN